MFYRLLRFLMAIILPVAMLSCDKDKIERSHYPNRECRIDQDEHEEKDPDEEKNGPVKVLFIGNSLTADAVDYIPRLLMLAGANNIFLTRCYHGGYTLKNYDLYYDKANNCGWRTAVPGQLWWRGDSSLKYSLKEIVESDIWDIVTIQGHTGNSEVWTWTQSEKARIQSLIARIKAAHPGHEPKIGYIFSTVYAVGSTVLKDNFSNNPDLMYRTVASVAESICKECDIDFVVPTGTAMQNLRTSVLNIDNGQDLSRDLIHVDYGIGRYTVGLTTYKAIFEELTGVRAEDIVFRTDWSCRTKTGHATPVTWRNAPIAIKSAEAAINSPFKLTSMLTEALGSVPDDVVPISEESFVPASFPVSFPLGYENGAYRFSTDIQASWRSEGVIFSVSQPQAVAEFEWGLRFNGETSSPFVEVASSSASSIGSPGFKGLWTGDYFEFRIPVEDLPAGTVVNISLPLYGRQHPVFWDIEY